MLIGTIFAIALLGRPSSATPPTVRDIVVSDISGELAALLAVVALARMLRWPQVFWEAPALRLRRRDWLWAIPVLDMLMALLMLAVAPWGQWTLAPAFVLLVGALLVGVAEELIVRGYILTSLRTRMPEARAALVSCAIFGLLHLVNLVAQGAAETWGQIITATLGGAGYYLTRRLSGSLLLPMVMHGMWDFGIFISAGAGGEISGASSVLLSLMMWSNAALNVAGLIVVLRRRAPGPRWVQVGGPPPTRP